MICGGNHPHPNLPPSKGEGVLKKGWIPAFAGMGEWGLVMLTGCSGSSSGRLASRPYGGEEGRETKSVVITESWALDPSTGSG